MLASLPRTSEAVMGDMICMGHSGGDLQRMQAWHTCSNRGAGQLLGGDEELGWFLGMAQLTNLRGFATFFLCADASSLLGQCPEFSNPGTKNGPGSWAA